MSGSPSVAVRTDNLALGDLVEHGLPTVSAQALRDVEVLVPEVIELQYQRIGLPTVCAWLVAEKFD
jgi:hypothetical protein